MDLLGSFRRTDCAIRFVRRIFRLVLASWVVLLFLAFQDVLAWDSSQVDGPAFSLPSFDAPATKQQSDEPASPGEASLEKVVPAGADSERVRPKEAKPEGMESPEVGPAMGAPDSGGQSKSPNWEDPAPGEGDAPMDEASPSRSDVSPPSSAQELQPAEDENVPISKPTPSVGEPLAAGIVKLLQKEIVAGIRQRGLDSQFRRFCAYAGERMSATARRYSGSELTGNCRLAWMDHMLRNPIDAPAEAERFTRELQKAVINDRGGLSEMLTIARAKMDLPDRTPPTLPVVDSPEAAFALVQQSLIDAQTNYAAALRPLGKGEIRELALGLYSVFAENSRVGHTLPERGRSRRLCDLMEKMDRGAFYAAAEDLVLLADPRVLDQLAATPEPQRTAVPIDGVAGATVGVIDTPAGKIVIGGRGDNTYQLDQMQGVAAVVDLGGNDTYYEGTVSLRRPVLVVIDLDGNDKYIGKSPGIQGSAIMGISLLVDRAGNDTYQAIDVAQGSSLCGVGMLIDFGGNDTFVGLRRVQGTALGGLGVLINRGGDDRYRGAMWTQGFGHPLGFGLLADLDGADHYYTGGLYPDSYPETPGYEGWGQGVGAGIRHTGSGGIGVLLDGGGDDVYEYDYLSHGGGYWCGLGFARDFGGNDRRVGGTKTAYNGGRRVEPDFVRFGCGWGCHYALGFLFDDAGDDLYTGTIMSVGFAWDLSVGYLVDFAGDDVYIGNQGNGAQAGLGVLFDYNGDDDYRGNRQGYATSGMTYHELPQAGGNFSFLIDYGGTDKYGCRAKNNGYLQRGYSGGFIIDRPRRDELPDQAAERPTRQGNAGS